MDQLSASIIGRNEIACHGLGQILVTAGFRVLHSETITSQVSGRSWNDDPTHLVILDSEVAQDALETCTALRAKLRQVRLVLLCDNFELNTVSEAFSIGVDGLLTTDIAPEGLISALRMVALGEKVMPSRLAQMLISGTASAKLPPRTGGGRLANLSSRETDILLCLSAGHSNKAIAGRLGLSEESVKAHIKAILRKQNFENRTQAAIWAFERFLGDGRVKRRE